MEFVALKKEEFTSVYEEMTKAFVKDEIRYFNDAVALLNNEKYNIYHIVFDNKKVGFITIWKLSKFYFVEHFVIYNQYRNKGLGGKAIDEISKKFKKIILEAELPNDEISKRRLGFYSRHEFVINEFKYIQPAYHKELKPVEMKLLSYQNKVINKDEVIEEIHKEVYGVDKLC